MLKYVAFLVCVYFFSDTGILPWIHRGESNSQLIPNSLSYPDSYAYWNQLSDSSLGALNLGIWSLHIWVYISIAILFCLRKHLPMAQKTDIAHLWPVKSTTMRLWRTGWYYLWSLGIWDTEILQLLVILLKFLHKLANFLFSHISTSTYVRICFPTGSWIPGPYLTVLHENAFLLHYTWHATDKNRQLWSIKVVVPNLG